MSLAEIIRTLFSRAVHGHSGGSLAADLAAIEGSFGVLTDHKPFARTRDERMDYLDRLANA